MEIFMIALSAMLINNYVLTKFLGICAFLGVSKKTDAALGMGAAVTFVMVISSVVTNLVYNQILARFNIEYLSTIAFVLVIAALVQFVEMVVRKLSPSLYKALGIYLPLITTNCAVLGMAVTNVQEQYTLMQSVANGLGAALGFTLAMLLMSGIREKLEYNENIPAALKGLPISLVAASLMSIAFMGFQGLQSLLH